MGCLATLLLMSILSLIALLFLLSLLIPLIIPAIQRLARAHFTWRQGSQFTPGDHRRNIISSSCKVRVEKLSIAQFKLCLDSEGSKERTECVFCLSNVDDGEEVRELRCRHIFHRSCLDEWLVRWGDTCPLCRDALLQPPTAAKCDEAADVDDDESSYMILAAYFQTGWWSSW